MTSRLFLLKIVDWNKGIICGTYSQKQPSKGVLRKSFSENMQQIYRRTPWHSVISIKLQSNFIEIKFWRGCSPVNLLHIFRKSFSQNTSKRLLLRYRPICNFVKKRLRHRCFLMNFAKKKFFAKKLYCRCSTGF